MKKFTPTMTLTVMFVLLLLQLGRAQTSTAPSGTGTSGDPYQIATLNNLYWLTQTTAAWASGKYFVQTADIDASTSNTWASGSGFSPIGNLSTRFYGNYDGLNYTITGLYISRTGYGIGMFGWAQGGTIQNLTLSNSNINATNINGQYGVGILVGGGYQGLIRNVNISGGTLTGYGSMAYMGTIIGYSQEKTIEFCTTSANLIHTYASNSSCGEIGGFIGYCYGDSIQYCSASGSVTANNNRSRVGGFVGSLVKSGTIGIIKKCFASGNISAYEGVGGFIGNMYTVTISDCYATGNVSMNASGNGIGGFMGYDQGSPCTFIRCYSKGLVTGSSWAGGFAGYANSPAMSDCFWDKTTSGKTSAVGTGTPTGTITGKTTAEMKTQSTFTNWDFTNVWNINASYNSGYPILRNVTYTPDPNTWTGTVSTDCNNTGNWSKSALPTSTDYVVIPNVSNKPIIGNGNTGSALNITIHTGSSLTDNGTLNTYGSVTNSGTFTTSSGAVNFTGSSAQTTTGLSGSFGSMTINNSSGVSLTGTTTITGTLTLTSGLLTLGAYDLTLGSSAAISGTPSSTNMIVATGTGQLIKTFTGTGSFVYPVGDNTGTEEYSPITLNFTSGTFSSATAGVLLSNSKYGSNTSASHYLNRYWTVSQSGISSFSCNVTAQYLAADVVGTESSIWTGKYSSSVWVLLNQSDAVNHRLTGTVTGFSTFTGGEQGVMPVSLSSFTSNVSGQNINLKWTTSSETNNTGFEIERAGFRQEAIGTWEKVGFVAGKGTTNELTSYAYTDTKLNTGKYQYRLKQIDNNGNFEYHSLSSQVEIGVPTKYALSQNYPNPFNPTTKIDFAIPLDSRVSVIIYDISGREVSNVINNEFRKAGYYTINFNASTLSSGIYFYRMFSNKFIETRKMVLIK